MASEKTENTVRRTALDAYHILDTPPEHAFDEIAALAADLCETPIALISLVDTNRQWFKARTGTALCETPLSHSVCAFTLEHDTPLIIPDLTQDSRTAANPLVTHAPHIRFYAGIPLITPDATPIGSLCVIDTQPRPQGLTARQTRNLQRLATQVMALLELRRHVDRQDTRLTHHHRAGLKNSRRALTAERENERLRDSDTRSRRAQISGRIGTFEFDPISGRTITSPEFCQALGLPIAPHYPASTLDTLLTDPSAGWLALPDTPFDPEGFQDLEFRIRHPSDGAHRWLLRRAERITSDSHTPTPIFGTIHDVTDRKVQQIHQQTILRLADELRALEREEDIISLATHVIGQTLAPSAVGYATMDDDQNHITIMQDWTAPGIDSRRGRYRLDDYGQFTTTLRQGRTVTIADVAAEVTPPHAAKALLDLGIHAQINHPLLDHKRLQNLFFVHSNTPRVWNEAEIAFVIAIADRADVAIAKRRAEATQHLLNHELSHRLKNTLAMVMAVSRSTLRPLAEQEPVKALEKRIQALSAAHDILLQRNWLNAHLRTLVHSVLTAVTPADRFTLEGPDFEIDQQITLSFSLVLHELVTNALKYGALSLPQGHVHIRWTIAADTLTFLWIEQNGPPIHTPPEKKGFGSRLITLGLLGTGGVTTRYEPSGLTVEMRALTHRIASR